MGTRWTTARTLGIGVVHQVAEINGLSTLITATETRTAVGGLLAQTTNIGRRSRDEFGLIPEFGLNVGCQITCHLRAYVGYSILYWRNDTIRPGSIIDRAVVESLIPTIGRPLAATTGVPARADFANRPLFSFRDVDFWAQGVSAGLEFSF